MKIIYAILFFIETVFLTGLAYLFLKKIDSGGRVWILILIFSGIVICILLLIAHIRNYIKQPPDQQS